MCNQGTGRIAYLTKLLPLNVNCSLDESLFQNRGVVLNKSNVSNPVHSINQEPGFTLSAKQVKL